MVREKVANVATDALGCRPRGVRHERRRRAPDAYLPHPYGSFESSVGLLKLSRR